MHAVDFEEALQRAQAEHAQKDAKALAILEVKDETIVQLEREVAWLEETCRNLEASSQQSVSAMEQTMEQTVVAKLQEEAAAAEGAIWMLEQSEWALAGAESTCQEELRRELRFAERGASVLASEAETERRIAAQAERKVRAVEHRLSTEAARSRTLWSTELGALEEEQAAMQNELAAMTLEMQAARSEARRRDIVDKGKPSAEDITRLEEALLQTQANLRVAEDRLHHAEQIQLEQASVEIQPRGIVDALRQEVAEVRRVAKARCEELLVEAAAANQAPPAEARALKDAATSARRLDANGVATQTWVSTLVDVAVEANMHPPTGGQVPVAPRQQAPASSAQFSSACTASDADVSQLRSELNELRKELTSAGDAVQLAETWRLSYEEMARKASALSTRLHAEVAKREEAIVNSTRVEAELQARLRQANSERDEDWRAMQQTLESHQCDLQVVQRDLQEHVAAQQNSTASTPQVAPSLTVALLSATTQLAHACRGLSQDRLSASQRTTRDLGVSVIAEELEVESPPEGGASSRQRDFQEAEASQLRGEAFSAEAVAARVSRELQECCQELFHVTTSEHEAQSFAAAALSSAEHLQQELEDVRTEASREHARAMRVIAAEAAAYRAHMSEVRELQEAERKAQGQLEVAEAKVLWVEVAREEDKESLRAESRVALSAVRSECTTELQSFHKEVERTEAQLEGCGNERSHLKAQLEDSVNLKNLYEAEASNTSLTLRTSLEELEALRAAKQGQTDAARQGEERLESEVADAHAREAILLQQLDRLREALAADKAMQQRSSLHSARRLVHLSEGHSSASASLPSVSVAVDGGEVEWSNAASNGRICSDRSDEEAVTVTQRVASQCKANCGVELKRLQRRQAQEREHRERLRLRVDAAEAEATEWRQQCKEAETQVKLLREEADRRRTMIASLQQRVRGIDAAAASKAEKDVEDAKQAAQIAKRDAARKDALVQEMRQELIEARHKRLELQNREEAAEGRLAAEGGKIKALKSESQRKDASLRSIRAQVDVLQMRLHSEECECEARESQIRKLKASVASSQGSSSRAPQSLRSQRDSTRDIPRLERNSSMETIRQADRSSFTFEATSTPPRHRPASPSRTLTLTRHPDAGRSPASLTLSGSFITASSERSHAESTKQDEVVRMPPSPEPSAVRSSQERTRHRPALWSSASMSGHSFPSSIDAATLAESVQILNLSRDDLTDFLVDGAC